MSRPVSIRVSYRDDAAYLIRLEAAVEKDDLQSEAWRRESVQMLRNLSLRLLEADGLRKSKARVGVEGEGKGLLTGK